MSKTPRTDAIVDTTYDYAVLVRHARQLETELSSARLVALEEAARVCEEEECDQTEYVCHAPYRIAKAIRLLSGEGK